MSTVVVPRLDVTLPASWTRLSNPGGPLTWAKGADGSLGALQASIPANADLLVAETDLPSRAGEMGMAFGFQTIEQVRGGPCAFGRYGAATMSGGGFKHFRIWVLVSDKPAVAMFTWISGEMGPEEADAIVLGIRPADDVPAAVRSMVLDGVRKHFEDDGHVVPGALVVGKGLFKLLPLTIRSEADVPAFAAFVRAEVATSKADAVAVVASAEFRGEDGTTQEAIGIYIETPKARQAYLLPVYNKGFLRRRRELGPHFEIVPNDDEALRNFFA
jgi:hypothetical protein